MALGSPCVSIYVPAFPRTAGGTAPLRALRAVQRGDVAGRRRPAAAGGCRSPWPSSRSGVSWTRSRTSCGPRLIRSSTVRRTGRRWGHRGASVPFVRCCRARPDCPLPDPPLTFSACVCSASPRPTSSADVSGGPRPGLVVGDEVVDLSDPAVGLPADMAELLALGPDALERAAPRRLRPGRPSPARRRCGGMRRCPAHPASWPSA